MSANLLTPREKEVFNLLINNNNTKDVARFLNISDKTVRNHISNVMQKLEVGTRYHAIIELVRLGELEIK